MRLVIITQDDRFFLPDALSLFFDLVESRHEVAAVVLLSVSPFGKRESMSSKARRTIRIFGWRFFFHYATKYIRAKIFVRKSVRDIVIGRGVPVLTLNSSINSADSLDKIRSYKPDILVSIAGNEIFRTPLIELAPKGCLNLHTGPLPRYRGLMPTFWVLRNGEHETAVSVFLVDEGIDSGPIIVQEMISIGSMNQEQLIRITKELGMRCLVRAIEMMDSNNVQLIENNESLSTYFKFPTADDVRIFRSRGARFY